MTLLTILLIVGAFLLVNAFYVAAEFALVGAPKAAIENRAGEGDRLSERLVSLMESSRQQDRYIATAQFGITIASLGLGMFGEHALADYLAPHLESLGALRWITAHGLASVIAVSLLTCAHIVFGEMLPKSIALQRTEGVARWLYWPMRISWFVAFPFVWTFSRIGALALRVLGIHRDAQTEDQLHTVEELRLIVEESEEGGALRAESGRLLGELFEFGDLTASQVMVPRVRVVGVPVGATPDDLRALLLSKLYTRYPVYDGDLDHIIGMLHVKDLLRRILANESIGLADVRSMPVVPETAPLDDVLAVMQRANAHMALVIDEHGGTAGTVSIEDLSEEVVGEITEDASEIPSLLEERPGVWRVAGTARLDEVGQKYDRELEHEDVDSVSGLVLARLGRPPVVGDVVEFEQLRFEVLSLAGRGVREARVSVISHTNDQGQTG
ncbi:MAG: HlyC/CorC family transporter [Acidobacteria bacterium]|nr:MAG: HlyC/CorC family transporter [Acidobacteriota bacterium]